MVRSVLIFIVLLCFGSARCLFIFELSVFPGAWLSLCSVPHSQSEAGVCAECGLTCAVCCSIEIGRGCIAIYGFRLHHLKGKNKERSDLFVQARPVPCPSGSRRVPDFTTPYRV